LRRVRLILPPRTRPTRRSPRIMRHLALSPRPHHLERRIGRKQAFASILKRLWTELCPTARHLHYALWVVRESSPPFHSSADVEPLPRAGSRARLRARSAANLVNFQPVARLR